MRTICRNCGGELAFYAITKAGDGYWRHVDPDSGLLESELCYWSPRADPMLP